MEQSVYDAIRAHAASAYPNESCGVVVVRKGKQVYHPCRNTSSVPGSQFAIAPEDYADAEDTGTITHIVHSHPNAAAVPSEADRIGCEQTGLPWIIINWPNGDLHEFAPSGYVAPLVGRQYIHGILDCYAIIRDYFAVEHQIAIPDYDREDKWWLKGQNLYAENFAAAGFVEITDGGMEVGDVLLMQMAAPVINHAAIYLGNNHILQHCHGRLSSRDVYGGYWQRCTVKTLRLKAFIHA